MPLYAEGKGRILLQLQRLSRGEQVGVVEIGALTREQFDALCRQKCAMGHPAPGSPVLVYKGKHHYESRVGRDGYQLHDLVLQIESALGCDSTVVANRSMTAVVSAHLRDDGYGHRVRDRAILELQARKPRGEVFSVIPKGDVAPKKQKAALAERPSVEVRSAPRITHCPAAVDGAGSPRITETAGGADSGGD